MTERRILVTGGAGFLGSHLCEKLLGQGNEVLCVDNFFTGSKRNIAHLLGHPYFELIRHDVCFPLYVEVDQIYNLACPASPVHYQWDAVQTVKTSVHGAINMLGLAKRLRIRILQTSTSEVYGDPEVHPQTEGYWGHVNPIGPRSCFSDDTEVLTREGWKLFQDLSYTDEILTLNAEDAIEYHPPQEIIRQRYQGELIAFKNSKIDLLVTPNHRMYAKERGKDQFTLIPAYSSVRWKQAEMQKKATWIGEEQEYFHLPGVSNSEYGNIKCLEMDMWLEFLGYYLTEGCVYLGKRKRLVNGHVYETYDYNVLIAQDPKANPEKCQKIEACLRRLPFPYHRHSDHQLGICNKQLTEFLMQFGLSKDRYIPTEFKNLSQRQLKILLDALMLGDGSSNGRAFYSSSPRLIGDVQEILLKLRMGGNASVTDTRKITPVYQLYILQDQGRDYLTPLYPERQIEHYNGYVGCVDVPNHVIYVRRNGKALFCGNCYDEGKRCAETLFFSYNRQHGLPIKVVRIFNTYGPRMHPDDGRVVSNFILQALREQPITVYGEGSQTRSFCYVDDLVDALTKVMATPEEFTGPVNLGNPHERTILELAEHVIRLTGSRSPIIHEPLPQDDPVRRRPDITLARQTIDWEPSTSLEEGLTRTIDYYRELLKS